jgi:hypothetical protein
MSLQNNSQTTTLEQKIDALINSINNAPGKIFIAANPSINIKDNKNLKHIITNMFFKKYPPT